MWNLLLPTLTMAAGFALGAILMLLSVLAVASIVRPVGDRITLAPSGRTPQMAPPLPLAGLASEEKEVEMITSATEEYQRYFDQPDGLGRV